MNCILLFLVGGPSQLDTWDMKPDAPEEIRGPFRPIATKVPGMQVSRDLPPAGDDDGQGVAGPLGLSHRGGRPRHRPPDDADRPAVHRRDRASARTAAWSSKYRRARGTTRRRTSLLPKPIGPTGGNLPHGQTAGYLGKTYDPFILNADPNDQGRSRCPICCRRTT